MSKIYKTPRKMSQLQVQKDAAQRRAVQIGSERDLRELAESGFNIVLMRRNFKKLEEQKSSKRLSKASHSEDDIKRLVTALQDIVEV